MLKPKFYDDIWDRLLRRRVRFWRNDFSKNDPAMNIIFCLSYIWRPRFLRIDIWQMNSLNQWNRLSYRSEDHQCCNTKNQRFGGRGKAGEEGKYVLQILIPIDRSRPFTLSHNLTLTHCSSVDWSEAAFCKDAGPVLGCGSVCIRSCPTEMLLLCIMTQLCMNERAWHTTGTLGYFPRWLKS